MEFANDSYTDDPYTNLYQTPKRPGKTNKSQTNEAKNVFNPYEQEKEAVKEDLKTKEKSLEEGLPKYVDLTKNAYEQGSRNEEEGEIPLLEELGIYPENIKKKMISVLTFLKIDKQILEDSDMAGPLLVFILFGVSLVLQTKTHFGYLYGLSLFGSLIICTLMNLMSNDSILLYSTISVLGYCMLPVVILSFISIFLKMNTIIGCIICFVTIILSSYSATRFFEIVLSMKAQKWLIFYPVVLFYTCFVLLTIF